MRAAHPPSNKKSQGPVRALAFTRVVSMTAGSLGVLKSVSAIVRAFIGPVMDQHD